MMSRLIAKGIIRIYSMRQRRVAVKPSIGIISNCDVCGGLMFNAQRYMHMTIFILHLQRFGFLMKLRRYFVGSYTLQYLDREHPHHFKLDLGQLDRIFEYSSLSNKRPRWNKRPPWNLLSKLISVHHKISVHPGNFAKS